MTVNVGSGAITASQDFVMVGINPWPVADPRRERGKVSCKNRLRSWISQTGGPTPNVGVQTYYLFFYRKIHEHERNCMEGDTHSCPSPWSHQWSLNAVCYPSDFMLLATAADFLIWFLSGYCSCYRPQRSCGKVMFSQACVKNSVQRGRGCVYQHALGQLADTPPGRHPPDGHCQRTVRILLECILVLNCVYARLVHPVRLRLQFSYRSKCNESVISM